MKPEYILLLAAGGVFLFLLFLYALVAYEHRKTNKKIANRIFKAYSDKNLQKMEYDVAFYDEETNGLTGGRAGDRQVTIDDLLSANGNTEMQGAEAAIFTQIEDDGVDEITGNYNPETIK